MKAITIKQLATMGGNATLGKYGIEHYAKMGETGAIGRLKKYGKDYYRKLSIKGLRGRYNKGLISKESLDKAIAKVNAKYSNPE